MQRICWCAALGWLFFIAPVAMAQPQSANEVVPTPGWTTGWPRQIGQLIERTRDLGPWDEQFGYVMSAAENVFVRNGWDSEPDLFALEFVRAVESQPPWAIQERMDTIMMMLSDRYALDADQENTLRTLMIRELNGLFRRHAPRILSYSMEALATRLNGDPFTPEQVARLAEQVGPVFADARNALLSAANEFSEQLTPDQREQLTLDLSAAQRRGDRIEEMRQQWVQGEWKPEDWGIENDPIQVAGELRRAEELGLLPPAETQPDTAGDGLEPAQSDARREPMQPEALPASPAAPQDNDPWAIYAREFIRRYQLEGGQTQRVWQAYREARERRDTYRRRHETRVAAFRRTLPLSPEAASLEQLRDLEQRQAAALERLFDQFKGRLERLPTRAQRRAALPEPPSPDSASDSTPR